MRDEIIELRQYYQSRAIKSDPGKIYIPYKYIIPLNVSYNWSLQNLSSYYTDIGFIFFMLFLMLIVGAIYTATYFRLKKSKTGMLQLIHDYPFYI